jgi:branched-subunit amino acid ABC-type transport system permease component
MRDLLPFVIVGLASGSIYGVAGLGLVLTFRTSGVFNFAHGAIAAAAAYAFYDLHTEVGLPWPVAALICVGLIGPVFGLAVERLARSLAESRPVMTIVATLGLLLAIQGFLTWRYSPGTLAFPQFLPKGGFMVSGVGVQYSQIITFVLGSGATAALYAFVRRTRLGVAMRGVVDDPALLAMSGIRPSRVRRASWMMGCAFAVLSGLLIGPSLGRDPYLLTLLVVQAFGAAAIGAFRSLPLTFAGGLMLGVATSVVTKYVVNTPSLRGLPTALPFIILFVALLVTPRSRLIVRQTRRPRQAPARPARPHLSMAAALGGGVLLVAVPYLVGPKLPVYVNMLIFVLVFLSLALLVWTSNQISLCHAVFAAFGATTFSHLTHGAGLPWLVALVLAGLAAVPVGLVVAIPAIRLSGIYLALATFGFALLMQRVVYGTALMFGVRGFRQAARPDLPLLGGGGDRSYYYVVLAIVALAALAVFLLSRSRLGRLLHALGDSPTALTTTGVSVNVTRLLVFGISAFLAGVAGALFISDTGQVSGEGLGPFNSLLWLAVLAICGTSLLPSAFCAAALLAIVPSYAPNSFTDYQTMLFGAAAIAAAVLSGRRVSWTFLRPEPGSARGPVQARWLEQLKAARSVVPAREMAR